MITMMITTAAAMPQARVMFTTVIDRCMVVIGVESTAAWS